MPITSPLPTPNAWLVLAVADARQYGGNGGYSDEPSSSYTWDSTVANAKAVNVGDAIVVWDKKWLVGASIVEQVHITESSKLIYRCPTCHKAAIKRRQTLKPVFRCTECGSEFDLPTSATLQVTAYSTSHESGWTDLQGLLAGDQLRKLCYATKSQLSIRSLNWLSLRLAVEPTVLGETFSNIDATLERIAGGHTARTVRARIGQGQFRKHLLSAHGSACAFTGPAPASVLEAAHLYSYANEAAHHSSGGLLMRRDIHRLFDMGSISVNPLSRLIDVSPELGDYPDYTSLHGRPLTVSLNASQVNWLEEHWAQHRFD